MRLTHGLGRFGVEERGWQAGLGAAALGLLDLGAQLDRSTGEGSGELLCSKEAEDAAPGARP